MGAMHAPPPRSPFKERMHAGWESTKSDFRKMKPLADRVRKRVLSRAFLSDTAAGLTFSMAVCMPIEMNFGGRTFEQSLHIRLAALPFGLALSGPYGMLREWFYRIMNVPYKARAAKECAAKEGNSIVQAAKGAFEHTRDATREIALNIKSNPAEVILNQARKFGVDVVSFLVGQLPLYAVIVAAAGATFTQICISCGAMLLASPVFGRPMGIWYDFVRKSFFRAEPAGAKQKQSEPPQANE